jgi:hypothetical protein
MKRTTIQSNRMQGFTYSTFCGLANDRTDDSAISSRLLVSGRLSSRRVGPKVKYGSGEAYADAQPQIIIDSSRQLACRFFRPRNFRADSNSIGWSGYRKTIAAPISRKGMVASGDHVATEARTGVVDGTIHQSRSRSRSKVI